MSVEIISSTAAVALNLWNGAGNNPEPAGWYSPGFDDAIWANAHVAETAAGNTLPPDAAPIWSGDLPLSASDRCLFRQRFTVPGAVLSATMLLVYDDEVSAVYINGNLVSVRGQGANVGSPEAVPGSVFLVGSNVLAVEGVNNSPGALNFAYVSYQLVLTLASETGTTSGADDATTGSYGTNLGGTVNGPAVRLRHASGAVDWEHDGILWRLRSRGLTCLQAPFPVMAGQSTVVLARDPATGLPMWSGTAPPAPPPPPVSRSYGQPDQSMQDTHTAPDPLPIPPNPQRACGAAYNMSALLCSLYDAIVQVVNKARSSILTAFSQTLKDDLQAELVSLLTEGEFGQWEIDAVQIALTVLAAIVETLLALGSSLPTIAVPNPGELGVSVFQVVRCCAFQALWLRGGDYLSESESPDGLGTRDYWQQFMNADWSFFAGSTIPGVGTTNLPWQVRWLDAIVGHVPDAAWARAAWVGAQRPQTTCTSCGGYPT